MITQKNDKMQSKLDKEYLKEQKRINKTLDLLIRDSIFNRTTLTQFLVSERLCLGLADICKRLANLTFLEDKKQTKDFKRKQKEFLGLALLFKNQQKEVERKWEKIRKALSQK